MERVSLGLWSIITALMAVYLVSVLMDPEVHLFIKQIAEKL